MRVMLLVASVLLAAGCSGKKYCERAQPYDEVKDGAILRAPAGLTVPEPDPSFTIPQVSVNAQAAALNEERPCLEIPPLLHSSDTPRQ